MAQKPSPKKTKTKKSLHNHQDSIYRAKHVKVRLAHHKHTLKKLPFYCTSYALIFFLLVFTSAFVLLIKHYASADQQITGSVNLSGVVIDRPPEIPAQITYPADKSRFNRSELDISGTCEPNNYVEVYRRRVFKGMAYCSNDGKFSMTIALRSGLNELRARTRDSIGQYGPDSRIIKVYYDQTGKGGQTFGQRRAVTSDPDSGNEGQLQIYTEPVQRGILLGQSIKLEYELSGSSPPYTLFIDWGDDSKNTLVKHDKEGKYSQTHTYKDPGQHVIRITAIGTNGESSTIQTVILVHGTVAPISYSMVCDGQTDKSNFSEYCMPPNKITKTIDLLWPAIIVATLMTASFWVGEKVLYYRIGKPSAKQK